MHKIYIKLNNADISDAAKIMRDLFAQENGNIESVDFTDEFTDELKKT